MHNKPKRIALIGLPVLNSVGGFQNVAIANYAEKLGRWKFISNNEPTLDAFRYLRKLDCSGAIVRVLNPAMVREVQKAKFPVVNISAWLENPGVPTVRHDVRQAGRFAAEHLLAKGFRHFGCVLSPGGWFIQGRHQGIMAALKERGIGCSIFVQRSSPLLPADRQRFIEWLRRLEPPAGLLFTDDETAPDLLDACRAAGREIPRDLGVVAAVLHSEWLVHCVPYLSSVEEDYATHARMTVECLSRMMSGEKVDVRPVDVPNLGVVERASSATFALEDRALADAVDFIRAHAHEPINIGDVIGRAKISRVTLERHFQKTLGQTPHDYLVEQRVRLAKELLLRKPALSLKQIAGGCGLTDRLRFNRVFRRITGKSPAAWRLAGGD